MVSAAGLIWIKTPLRAAGYLRPTETSGRARWRNASSGPSDRSVFLRTRRAEPIDWRFLVDAANAWSDGSGTRNRFDTLFAEIGITEEFHGYPGPRLMAALKEAAASGDAAATAALATRIMQSLQTRSFRQHASDWELHDDGDARSDRLAAAVAGRNGVAPTLFRGADRHRRGGDELAKSLRRMAQAAPSARRLRLRAGVCRKL